MEVHLTGGFWPQKPGFWFLVLIPSNSRERDEGRRGEERGRGEMDEDGGRKERIEESRGAEGSREAEIGQRRKGIEEERWNRSAGILMEEMVRGERRHGGQVELSI